MSKIPSNMSPEELAEYEAVFLAIFTSVLAMGERLGISKAGLIGTLEGMIGFLLEDKRSIPELVAKDRERGPV